MLRVSPLGAAIALGLATFHVGLVGAVIVVISVLVLLLAARAASLRLNSRRDRTEGEGRPAT